MNEIKMNEVQKALDAAFKALDMIPVSGAGVELMAAARANLRLAYKMAGEKGKAEIGPAAWAREALARDAGQEPEKAQCAAGVAMSARETAT